MPKLVKLDYSNVCNPHGTPLPKHLQDQANLDFRSELASVMAPTDGKCFLTVTVALLNKYGYSHVEFAKVSLLNTEKQPVGDYEPMVNTVLMNEDEVPDVAYLHIGGILFPDLIERSLILPCRLDTVLDAPYSRIAVWVDFDAEKTYVSTDNTYNLNWMTDVPVKFGTNGAEEWNENVLIEIPEEACAA